jgi:hypothetical protein
VVLRRLRDIFGRKPRPSGEPSPLFGLDSAERERIGTEDDPLRGFESAMERHEEAAKAEQGGDPEKAICLYETSVAEGFVGSHPYERLASLYERRRDYREALRVSEIFIQIATNGRPEWSATGGPYKGADSRPANRRSSHHPSPKNRRKTFVIGASRHPTAPM